MHRVIGQCMKCYTNDQKSKFIETKAGKNVVPITDIFDLETLPSTYAENSKALHLRRVENRAL